MIYDIPILNRLLLKLSTVFLIYKYKVGLYLLAAYIVYSFGNDTLPSWIEIFSLQGDQPPFSEGRFNSQWTEVRPE